MPSSFPDSSDSESRRVRGTDVVGKLTYDTVALILFAEGDQCILSSSRRYSSPGGALALVDMRWRDAVPRNSASVISDRLEPDDVSLPQPDRA